jgi:hypothetical protein
MTPTVPTITFERECILLEPDITSNALLMGKDFSKQLAVNLGIPFALSEFKSGGFMAC